MTHILPFLKGLLIALIVAVPLGPMAILAIKRSFNYGFLSGWATALGIAIGDTIFAIIAGFSLTFLMDKIRIYEKPIEIIGALLLFGFGVFTYCSKVTRAKDHEHKAGFFGSLTTSVILTLSNILTLLGFIALFSWVGMSTQENYLDTSITIAGVFIGILSWFTLINILIHLFKSKLDLKILNITNKVFGIGICGASIMMLIKLLF